MRRAALLFFIAVFLLFISGCGGQSSVTTSSTVTNTPAVQTTPVGMTVTDTPPAGVTVLFFQLSITGASLTPQSGTAVSLVSSSNAIPVDVSQLQTDSAFVGSQNVTAGTYTGLSVTFANPQLTIFNASDGSLGSTCAVGSVCELTFTTSTSGPLTVNFSSSNSSLFPLTLSANSPLAFKLDIHLDTVIQNNLSLNLDATNGVTLSEVSTPQTGVPVPAVGKLTGTVESVTTSSNQFTLQTLEGRTFTIDVNGSTTYSDFPSGGSCSSSSEGFGCLAAQQVVNVTVTLQSDGSLLATAITYIQLPTQQTVEGTIVGLSTSGGNTIMDLIVQKPPLSAAVSNVLPVGHHASVTVPSNGVTYEVGNPSTFSIPSGLTFSASSLQVGQEVLVVVQGSVTPATSSGNSNANDAGPLGRGEASFTASAITLEESQITGTVASAPNTTAGTFGLATMPGYFVPPSATPGARPTWAPVIITVQTTGQTTFTNVSNLSGLAVNNVVSVGGFVFSTSGGVTVAAETVLLRPGPTPLF